jgi:hypothetical protein
MVYIDGKLIHISILSTMSLKNNLSAGALFRPVVNKADLSLVSLLKL